MCASVHSQNAPSEESSHLISQAVPSRPWMEGVPSTPGAVGILYPLQPQSHCTDAITEVRDGQRLFRKPSLSLGFHFCDIRGLNVPPSLLRASCLHPHRHLVPQSQVQSDKEAFPKHRGAKLSPRPCKDGPIMTRLWGICSFPDFSILSSTCLVSHGQSTGAEVPARMAS